MTGYRIRDYACASHLRSLDLTRDILSTRMAVPAVVKSISQLQAYEVGIRSRPSQVGLETRSHIRVLKTSRHGHYNL